MLQYDIDYPSLDVDLPDWMNWVLSIFSLNFPDLVMSPECEWDFNYWSNWLFAVLAPMACVAGLGVAYKRANYTFQNPAARHSYQDKCVQATVIFICVMYVFVTAKAIEPTYCDTLEDLWAMNTEQVIAFCEQCAGEDECALDYDKAEEYLGHLSFAAWEGSAA